MRRAWWCAIAAVLAARVPAFADGSGGAPIGEPADGNPTYHPNYASSDQPIVITTSGDRSAQSMALAGGIAAAGVVLAGVGLAFTFEYRSAADKVAAEGPTGQPWTAADQSEYDRAHDESVKAVVFYSLGGAAIAAALVTWIVTAPHEHRVTIRPHAAPTIAPAPGGALLGGIWRF